MSKILIAVTPLAGHVNPILPVAERLAKVGHKVFFQTADIFAEQIDASGLHFLPLIGNANYDYHKLAEVVPELLTTSGEDQANVYIKRLLADRIPDQYRGLQQAIAKHEIELVMIDLLFLGAMPLLLSGETRPPLISCGVIAPSWTDPAASIFTGPHAEPGGRERNIADNEMLLARRRPGHQHIDAVLKQLGTPLPAEYKTNDTYSLPDVFLQFGSEAFEYPRENLLRNLIFTGPIVREKTVATELPEWMERIDRRMPLVLVSQGTLANFNFDQLLNPALAGLAGERVQVVATAGGSKSGKIVTAGSAIVESYIPYEQILPMASVFVTNGGYNGVQQTLSYGVPIVCCGASEDKPLVSGRVAWSGVGIAFMDGVATPERIRDAVREVFRDPNYGERARKLGAEIAKTDALETITNVVESTLEKHASQTALADK